MPIDAEPEVGRAGDVHLGADALGRPAPHGFPAIAEFDGVHGRKKARCCGLVVEALVG